MIFSREVEIEGISEVQQFYSAYKDYHFNKDPINSGLIFSTFEWFSLPSKFLKSLEALKLEPSYMILFSIPSDIPCHLDSDKDRIDYSASLNIPIRNCEGLKLVWYDNAIIESFNDTVYGRIPVFKEGNIIQTDDVNKTTFVRVDVPHGVINQNKSNALLLSIRFSNGDLARSYLGPNEPATPFTELKKAKVGSVIKINTEAKFPDLVFSL